MTNKVNYDPLIIDLMEEAIKERGWNMSMVARAIIVHFSRMDRGQDPELKLPSLGAMLESDSKWVYTALSKAISFEDE